jgi:hypothetical protein
MKNKALIRGQKEEREEEEESVNVNNSFVKLFCGFMLVN